MGRKMTEGNNWELNNLGTRIKVLLFHRGIKQRWMADKLGVTYNNFNSFCSGRYNLNFQETARLCDILKLDLKRAWEGYIADATVSETKERHYYTKEYQPSFNFK